MKPPDMTEFAVKSRALNLRVKNRSLNQQPAIINLTTDRRNFDDSLHILTHTYLSVSSENRSPTAPRTKQSPL